MFLCSCGFSFIFFIRLSTSDRVLSKRFRVWKHEHKPQQIHYSNIRPVIPEESPKHPPPAEGWWLAPPGQRFPTAQLEISSPLPALFTPDAVEMSTRLFWLSCGGLNHSFAYILDADSEICLEVVEVFGQLVAVVIIREQPL